METDEQRGFHWFKFFKLRCNLKNLLHACAFTHIKKFICGIEFPFKFLLGEIL